MSQLFGWVFRPQAFWCPPCSIDIYNTLLSSQLAKQLKYGQKPYAHTWACAPNSAHNFAKYQYFSMKPKYNFIGRIIYYIDQQLHQFVDTKPKTLKFKTQNGQYLSLQIFSNLKHTKANGCFNFNIFRINVDMDFWKIIFGHPTSDLGPSFKKARHFWSSLSLIKSSKNRVKIFFGEINIFFDSEI